MFLRIVTYQRLCDVRDGQCQQRRLDEQVECDLDANDGELRACAEPRRVQVVEDVLVGNALVQRSVQKEREIASRIELILVIILGAHVLVLGCLGLSVFCLVKQVLDAHHDIVIGSGKNGVMEAIADAAVTIMIHCASSSLFDRRSVRRWRCLVLLLLFGRLGDHVSGRGLESAHDGSSGVRKRLPARIDLRHEGVDLKGHCGRGSLDGRQRIDRQHADATGGDGMLWHSAEMVALRRDGSIDKAMGMLMALQDHAIEGAGMGAELALKGMHSLQCRCRCHQGKDEVGFHGCDVLPSLKMWKVRTNLLVVRCTSRKSVDGCMDYENDEEAG
mmetsp:Transcript_6968/g.20448  ORF Transcript_6968/g.20448 Transcript_6968/m.20448 type:complete len:331 (-) Transcript_6968:51-1043(-)